MAFTDALYYPDIDIADEQWLRTALLYWNAVHTIVPISVKEPYSTETAKILRSEGFLIPRFVGGSRQEIVDLTSDVVEYPAFKHSRFPGRFTCSPFATAD